MESSLRSRPAKAPPRKAQRTPTKLAKSGPTRERSRNRIDDKIKRRMSMRYAEISSPTQLTGTPAIMGLIPAGQEPDTPLDGDEDIVRDKSSMREEAKAAADDKRLLSAEDFDPSKFLKFKFSNSTEDELKSLGSSLRTVAQETSSELQRSVFKNYAEFVLISKEISVLENEMLELKELLSDYKSMPSTLHVPDPTSASSSMLSTYKRSSISDLRVLYFNQMQNLHASIEGASKFVPTTPGRHVVGEMENVFSLNTATYKVTGKVKFVVLDDAVLVARRRRRNAGGPGGDGSGSTVNEGKLVAEKCWPLNEMLVLDTKDSPSMTNVFKIRHGKETHVYRTEAPADKKALLAQFRQVAEELSQKRRKEREGEHERRKSMWQGGGRNLEAPPVPEWMSDLVKKGGEIPGMGTDAKGKAERDARWVGEWSDALTVAIALKEWSKAVDLVDQGQARVAVMPLLANKLPQLTSQLISSLLESLSHPSNRKSTVVNLISLLNGLKAGAAARNTFLEMRSKVIRGLTRKIRFDGDIGTYVGELAVVYFTGIKHSADWYLASFKENEVASCFIVWTKKLLEEYAATFRKQVYSKDVDQKLVEETIHITHTQCRKLLQEYGLDFRYLLDEVLVENPKKPLEARPALSLNEHRVSKFNEPKQTSLSIEQKKERRQLAQKEDTSLPGPPEPPILSAPPPPVNRRNKAHAPVTMKSVSPAPPANSDVPPPPPDLTIPRVGEGSHPPPSAALRHNILSPTSVSSAYPTRFENASANAPLFSSRPNQAPSAMRSRTSAQQDSVPPNSAPVPQMNLSSPLPRPPMSAAPFRMRERSDSVKDRDVLGLEGAREGGGYHERPPRSVKASPAPRTPAVPPPRSANRPGSTLGQRTPVAIAQHEGMI